MAHDDKVYIITGAGHRPGIGSAVAQHLLDHGAKLVINGRTFDTDWQTFLVENSNAILVQGDVTQDDVQTAIVRSALDTWGKINGLINNASTGSPKFDDSGLLSKDTWCENFLVNCTSVYRLSMLCWPVLRQHQGSIVNIASRAAVKSGAGNNLAYSVSKAALVKLTQELAVQFAPVVNVNCVSPGLVLSQRAQYMMADRFDQVQQNWFAASRMQDTVNLKDVSHAVELCLTSVAMTGQNIAVCGCAAM